MRRRGLRLAESAFHEAAEAAGFRLDPAQILAVRRLAAWPANRRLAGAYLWGPVGRGKTWLADRYVELVPTSRVRRVHFHDFFADLHRAVHRHRDAPHAVAAAVDELVGGLDLLCFDELHVHDPGDAMLVTRLLRDLVRRRTALVATSNYPPEGLLPDPRFHELFGPGIALLETHLDVVPVAGPVDHRTSRVPRRRRTGFRGRHLVVPARLRAPLERTVLPVGSRSVTALAVREEQVWFAFSDLCEARTSAADYLSLATRFPRWVLTEVPPLARVHPDARQRFVTLVDVLHDRGVELVLHTDVELEEVLAVPGGPPDLARTASRLLLLDRESGLTHSGP